MVKLLEYSLCERIPLIGNFEITRRCPFKCWFCYNYIDQREEIKTEKIISLIDEFKNMGCIHMHLSGGEPFIHPDFNEIYLYIVKSGLHISVETNISYLPRSTVEILSKYPPMIIMASMYAYTDETFKRVTRSSSSIDKVRQNIQTLKSRGIKILLRTPVSIDNYKELHLINEYANSLEIEFNFNEKIWWRQDGVRINHLRCHSETIKEYRSLDPIYESLFNKLKKIEEMPYAIKNPCNWGDKEFYVNPFGEMHYCVVFWANKYDLIKGSFMDAWNNWYPKYRKDSSLNCIGRKLFPTNNKCPSGFMYFHENMDVTRKMEDILFENLECEISAGATISEALKKYEIENYFEKYSCMNELKKYYII